MNCVISSCKAKTSDHIQIKYMAGDMSVFFSLLLVDKSEGVSLDREVVLG